MERYLPTTLFFIIITFRRANAKPREGSDSSSHTLALGENNKSRNKTNLDRLAEFHSMYRQPDIFSLLNLTA